MDQSAISDPRIVVRQWLSEAVRTGSLDAYQSKRKSLRASWNRPMELRIGDEILYVRSRDVGEGGIGLLAKRKLKRNQSVLLRRQEGEPWIRCRVVHLTPTIGTYKMGVELEFEFD